MLSGQFEFGIARSKDGRFFAGEFVRRGDVADGAVQTDGVVVLHPLGDDASGVFQAQRGLGSDAVGFDGAVVAFEFAVGLRVIRAGAHVGAGPVRGSSSGSRGR